MVTLAKKLALFISFFFCLLALVLLGQIDVFLFNATEFLAPGYGWVVVGLVVLCEIFAFIYLYRSFFGRPSRLIIRVDASEEEKRLFAKELKIRLEKNPHVRSMILSKDDPEFVAKAMAHLDEIADAQIRSNGKKVFLGTALAQNGKLDALIVFFSLCRMVWRISSIYNQKPTFAEFMSVCQTVSSSTFVAFSIEALDIPQMITDTMNEMMPSVGPAVAANSVPFMGSCLHVFTESLVDGAANCLLAVRAGIITKRAYSYSLTQGVESLRKSCVRETATMMLDISKESVGYVASALKQELQEITIGTGKNLVNHAAQGIRNTASAAKEAVESGASKVSEGTSYLADGAVLIKDGISSAAGQVTDLVVTGAKSVLGKRKSEDSENSKENEKKGEKKVEKKEDEFSAVLEETSYLADGVSLIKDGVSSAANQVTDLVVTGAKSVLGKRKSEGSENSKENEKKEEKKFGEKKGEESVAQEGGSSLTQAAKSVGRSAVKAASVVGEGTSLIVSEVGSVANKAASIVDGKRKAVQSFLSEKKENLSRLFSRKK